MSRRPKTYSRPGYRSQEVKRRELDRAAANDVAEALVHDHAIEWPNGEGFTPCTALYRETMDERDAIHDLNDPREPLDSLSPEDLQRWNVLDDRLLGLQADGHVGQSERI